jgi:hypothetical protein
MFSLEEENLQVKQTRNGLLQIPETNCEITILKLARNNFVTTVYLQQVRPTVRIII